MSWEKETYLIKWPCARNTGRSGSGKNKKNPDFSCWAWCTPWGHVLSLKFFCRNPVLSWAISYSVFQSVKFSNSFEFVCRTIFSTFWHLVVKFGYNKWFLSNKNSSVFPFRWIIGEIKKIIISIKKIFGYFFELEM